MMSRVLFIVLLACASSFAATWETMPGASRAINSGLSASRDATFPSWQYLPRETRTGGADFGFGAIYSKRTTLRLGFHGMLELESDNDHVEPYPGEDHSVNLWRGVFGFSTMFALDRLGEKTFGQGGNIEFGFSVRHESDHGYDDLWFHIFGPPDVGFPADGVIAEGAMNRAGWVIAEVDLARLTAVRTAGQVQTLRHWAESPGRARPVETVTLG